VDGIGDGIHGVIHNGDVNMVMGLGIGMAALEWNGTSDGNVGIWIW
jgi:hypothetical protein